ncbi:MAG: hypothetical protein IJ903_03345, partial [Ruminococcus sp.]|nr:hypothetical protein [Ruminococcus sp.]
TPVFTKIGSKSTTSHGTTVSINSSPTSPKTGDNTMLYVIGLSSLAALAFVALGVKLAVSKK